MGLGLLFENLIVVVFGVMWDLGGFSWTGSKRERITV